VTPVELKEFQGKYNNYELGIFLSHGDGVVSEKTVGRWINGDRLPRGPAMSLLYLVRQILEKGKVTREEILIKVGYGFKIRLEKPKEVQSWIDWS